MAMNLFQFASNDQSIAYLKQIFGSVGSVLDAAGTETTINIVGVMFKYLNTLGLTIGAILVVYIVVVGLLKTASEGEFLGKHWNSLWVPIRMVIGIASLFPTTTGYSALQVAMMWLILQGVGAGDALWTIALNYNATMGSPYATIGLGMPLIQVQSNMQDLYKGLVCQATMFEKSGAAYGENNHSYYYCGSGPTDPQGKDFCNQSALDLGVNSKGGTKIFGPGAVSVSFGAFNATSIPATGPCGQVTFCNPSTECATGSSMNCVMCTAQIAEMQKIVPVLGGIAQVYADADMHYLEFYHASRPADPDKEAWIVNYCAANNIQPADCCSVSDLDQPKLALNQNLPCAHSQVATSLFDKYPPYALTGSGTYGSAADATVNDLYKNFVLPNMVKVQSTSPGAGATSFIDAAASEYLSGVSKAVLDFITGQPTSTLTGGWEVEAQQNGWMMAGAYYYKMASYDSQEHKKAPAWSAVSTFPSNDLNNSLHGYRDNIAATTTLLNSINHDQMSQGGGDTGTFAKLNQDPYMAQVGAVASAGAIGIQTLFSQMLTGTSGGSWVTTPLVKLHAFGEGLIILGDVLFALFTAIFLVMLWLNWDVFGLGTGVVTPLGTATIGMLIMVTPLMYGLIGAVYGFGGLIAVYTPLVPYIIYMMGVIGWIIAVIEAMVAMPFVALGIMSPSGEHEILGRAHHGLGNIFNLLLRPCLMVFGMIASMLLMSVAVTLINATFSGVMSSIGGVTGANAGASGASQGQMGIPELIMFIAAYTSLVLTVVNKAATLIFLVPENALTMIGFQPVKYGEEGALAGVKGAVEGAAATVGGQMAGMAQGVASKGIQAAKSGLESKKAQDAAAAAAAVKAAENKPDAASDDKPDAS